MVAAGRKGPAAPEAAQRQALHPQDVVKCRRVKIEIGLRKTQQEIAAGEFHQALAAKHKTDRVVGNVFQLIRRDSGEPRLRVTDHRGPLVSKAIAGRRGYQKPGSKGVIGRFLSRVW